MILFFLSSGLFLGWSLGANDAANVFGSAVGSKMVSFRRAVTILAIFVVLGAVFQGSGASHTLGKLGAVDAIAGAFTVALAAAFTVFLMTKYKLPVSTSQAIVGAIIGWNLFTGNDTDLNSLSKIVSTWVLCPILGGVFAIILHVLMKWLINKSKIHLIRLDRYLRIGLLVVGAFGSFSLGANNIANVMGVFVTAVAPEKVLNIGFITLSGTQQLFLIGGLAIAVGAITYSKQIMQTVGNNILELSSESALVVVLAHSLVLFVFSSQALQNFLLSIGLPPIPLVPVSSSQAIVGAILGVGLLKKAREIKFGVLGSIATGWVTTPILAGLISFFSLFFVSNVFNLEVTHPDTTIQLEKNHFSISKKFDLKEISSEENAKNYSLDSSVLKGKSMDSLPVDKYTNRKEEKREAKKEWKEKYRGDPSVVIIRKEFLFIAGGFLVLIIAFFFLFINRLKSKENRELLEKTELIEESQKAYMESELENSKIINDSLENELEFHNRELTNLAINLINKNEILEKIQAHVKKLKSLKNMEEKEKGINELWDQINHSINIDKERKTFYQYIEEANNDFFISLSQKFPALTLKEKQLAALLRLNLSSKDIALLQNISPKSVEMNRYRLRQKLKLEAGDNLTEFINKI